MFADDVRVGLTRGEFFLEYMPTVSLIDGKCVGAEALSRWRRADEIVPPDRFIPIIEETSVAGLLTYWVIETAGNELGDWLRTHRHTHIGINVPPALLGRGGMEYAAMKAGFSDLHSQVILEVTERGLPDHQGVAAIEAAAKLGVRVALDDVTLTGANLAVLFRCKLDMIKIDRTLVSQIVADLPCPNWLAGLSALLKATPVGVIAEGVETWTQLAALREAGVTMAQGYYFSRPLSAIDFKRFYDAQEARV